jgi:hypothetical protein
MAAPFVPAGQGVHVGLRHVPPAQPLPPRFPDPVPLLGPPLLAELPVVPVPLFPPLPLPEALLAEPLALPELPLPVPLPAREPLPEPELTPPELPPSAPLPLPGPPAAAASLSPSGEGAPPVEPQWASDVKEMRHAASSG